MGGSVEAVAAAAVMLRNGCLTRTNLPAHGVKKELSYWIGQGAALYKVLCKNASVSQYTNVWVPTRQAASRHNSPSNTRVQILSVLYKQAIYIQCMPAKYLPAHFLDSAICFNL